MTRASQTVSFVLLASSAYLLLLLPQITNSTSIPSVLPLKVQTEIVPVLPFLALISMAAYLLGRLGLGVVTFRDCDGAYEELMDNIASARRNLELRKIKWT